MNDVAAPPGVVVPMSAGGAAPAPAGGSFKY
jgi:hypothetical protein